MYRELRRLAAASLRGESRGQTLQPTALVHELYFQLPDVQHIDWQSRGQFLNVAAKMMRNILVDHARKRRAAKRGGGAHQTDGQPGLEDGALDIDVLLVHESLDRLADDYPRHARVVELRFFGGLDGRGDRGGIERDGCGEFHAHGGTGLDLRPRLAAACNTVTLTSFHGAWKSCSSAPGI